MSEERRDVTLRKLKTSGISDKDNIIKVLEMNEDSLSDGYGFYCGGKTKETLERIANEIQCVLSEDYY